jgi:hypothetical protein
LEIHEQRLDRLMEIRIYQFPFAQMQKGNRQCETEWKYPRRHDHISIITSNGGEDSTEVECVTLERLFDYIHTVAPSGQLFPEALQAHRPDPCPLRVPPYMLSPVT